MNVKDLMLGIFVIMTVALASSAHGEYAQVDTLNSELMELKRPVHLIRSLAEGQPQT